MAPLASLLLLAGPAAAIDFDWNVAGPADWNVGTNWDPEGPPSGGVGNNAFINNGGTAEMVGNIGDIQDIFVGAGAATSGTLNQAGGNTFQGTGGWTIVGQDGGTGTYNLSGGTQGKERLYIGRGTNGDGTLNLSGTGTVDVVQLYVGVDGGTGEVQMTGGTVTADTVQLIDGTFNMTAGSLSAATFDLDGGVFSATNLTGNLVQDGGTTSPGSSPGTMTVTGNYSLNSGDLLIELAGLVAGTGYDQLVVTGDVSLAGSLDLLLSFVPSYGDMFTIIDNQGANAVAGSFLEGVLLSASGIDFSISYTGGDGNDVVLTVVGGVVGGRVPEPGIALLMATGLGFLVFGKLRGLD